MAPTGKTVETPEAINLHGVLLCLDFANSVDWDTEGIAIKDEALETPDALARWGRRLELYPATGPLPEVSAAELARALELREALHRIFRATVNGEAAPAELLAVVARNHAEAAAAGTLQRVDDDGAGYRLAWAGDDERLVRFAVTADAMAVLADPKRLERVRLCPGHDCGWLFYDVSGRRRWCSMEGCGSRAKMKRLYERQRGAAR